MYFHRDAGLVYLSHPRTASHATGSALCRAGWEKVGRYHHASIRSAESPFREEREAWTTITTVRNHWDAMVSWCCILRKSDRVTPAELERLMLENSWIGKDALYWLHLDDADAVLRYEHGVQAELERVLSGYGLPTPTLERENVTAIRAGRAYAQFYDDGTRAWVADRFAGEIERLGYEFES